MPKSAKKRKEKAADFTKAKLKVGKEKKAPSNVIDTSFKARSIALPSQSITATKDDTAPTTKRKLTFDQLLSHLKHYSPGVRKDAIDGLLELLEAHWFLAGQYLAQLVNATSRIIGDEDAGVRKRLLSFFSWLLPRLSKSDLTPHAPTLLLFAASAQTHIFPDIRIDATRFLSLFLEYIPESVVEGWDSGGQRHGARILEGYLGNLSAGVKRDATDDHLQIASTTSVILSPSSKLVVLQSLASFLDAALSRLKGRSIEPVSTANNTFHAWFLSPFFATQDAFHRFEHLLAPRGDASWLPEADADEYPRNFSIVDIESPWTLQELENIADTLGKAPENSSDEDSVNRFLFHLARNLHPILLSTLLDYAPSVFAPDAKSSEVETSMIVTISRISSLLYGTLCRQVLSESTTSLMSDLETFLGYMAPYFPFEARRVRDHKLEQDFQQLNLNFCELTSLLVQNHQSSSHPGPRGRTKQNAALRFNKFLAVQMTSVSDYIIRLLRGRSTGTSQIDTPINSAAYFSLLPSIWAIINSSSSELAPYIGDVLQAIIDHACKTSSKSATKRLTIEFVSRLILLDTEPQYRGRFRSSGENDVIPKFEEWLTHLPQVLWELGNKDFFATETILCFLLRLVQRRSPFLHAKTVAALQARLVPYFVIKHSTRGQMSGPYSRLPQGLESHLRRLSLSVVSTVLDQGCQWDVDGYNTLSTAVGMAVAETPEANYWSHLRKGKDFLKSV